MLGVAVSRVRKGKTRRGYPMVHVRKSFAANEGGLEAG
jgi:hypothetical protein